jgi:type IV pilus assembly protein PilY1
MFKHKLMIMLVLLSVVAPTAVKADDIDIYGVSSLAVAPNVLILLDTSGSMQIFKDVGQSPYSSSTTYAKTSYNSGDVYYLTNNTYPPVSWTFLCHKTDIKTTYASSTANTANQTILNYLNTTGYTPTTLDYYSSNTSHSQYLVIVSGNFLNYEYQTASPPDYRYSVAKNAIVNIVGSTLTSKKRYGLMVFNHIVVPCGGVPGGVDGNTAVVNAVNALKATDFTGGTPLAETTAEAGLYFTGSAPWFNNTTDVAGIKKNGKYISPIQEPCQNNYLIIVTDGEPTGDNDTKLYKNIYLNGKTIGDYDSDGMDLTKKIVNGVTSYTPTAYPVGSTNGGTHFLDDVTRFLYLAGDPTGLPVASLTNGTAGFYQRVNTFAVGLTNNSSLLKRAGTNAGGDYFFANSIPDLENALKEIDTKTNPLNSVFLAPSVPVNRTSKTGLSDWIYISFFKPRDNGEWIGNIKKYRLGPNGDVFDNSDKNVSVVDSLGNIMNTACSYWTTLCNDGASTDKGGVGEVLQLANASEDTRTIYYYTGTDSNLTAVSNQFKTTNATLVSLLGSTASTIITNARTFLSTWKLGAIIHSAPEVVHYSSDQTVIFVGANDGMLHCFDDNTGQEVWGFIPPGQKNNLSYLGGTSRHYYVDGSPVVTYGDTLMTGTQLYPPKYMIFGERRGGNNYYVMDISDYKIPKYRYSLPSTILGADETLGQSWGKPQVCIVSTKTKTAGSNTIVDETGLTNVFLVPGGYDYLNEDKPCLGTTDCPASTDTYGKAIFASNIDALTAGSSLYNNDTSTPKALFKVTGKTTGIVGGSLTNSIVDVYGSTTLQTSTGKDITTRIYAGDLGGKVFAFADDLQIKAVSGVNTALVTAPDGTFPIKLCLFKAAGKKIFFAPKVSRLNNTFSEYVVFGTGDREHPNDTKVSNGIYVVRNTWVNTTLPYTESDLYDATNDVNKLSVTEHASSKNGWFIKFPDSGEKIISAPIITNGVIYFTTYVPATTAAADPCAGSGVTGTSYLYAIDLKTGVPVYDPNKNNKVETSDRREMVAIMAQPTLTDNLISTPAAKEVPSKADSNYFFWRQL